MTIRAWAEYGVRGQSESASGDPALAEPTSTGGLQVHRDRGELKAASPLRSAAAVQRANAPPETEPDEPRFRLVLQVSDTGIGIPKAQQGHIFGAFSQVAGQKKLFGKIPPRQHFPCAKDSAPSPRGD